jgi:hypothetical protein
MRWQTASVFKSEKLRSLQLAAGRGVAALFPAARGPYAHALSAAGYPISRPCPRIQLALRPPPVRFGESGDLAAKALNRGLKR